MEVKNNLKILKVLIIIIISCFGFLFNKYYFVVKFHELQTRDSIIHFQLKPVFDSTETSSINYPNEVNLYKLNAKIDSLEYRINVLDKVEHHLRNEFEFKDVSKSNYKNKLSKISYSKDLDSINFNLSYEATFTKNKNIQDSLKIVFIDVSIDNIAILNQKIKGYGPKLIDTKSKIQLIFVSMIKTPKDTLTFKTRQTQREIRKYINLPKVRKKRDIFNRMDTLDLVLSIFPNYRKFQSNTIEAISLENKWSIFNILLLIIITAIISSFIGFGEILSKTLNLILTLFGKNA